jgi:hypothetical protein
VFLGTAAKAERFLPSLRVARVALCDIPTCCIINVLKVVLCDKQNTLRGCLKMTLIFRGRRSSCCVLSLSSLRQVAATCKFRGRRGILWDVMKLTETSHETKIFRYN